MHSEMMDWGVGAGAPPAPAPAHSSHGEVTMDPDIPAHGPSGSAGDVGAPLRTVSTTLRPPVPSMDMGYLGVVPDLAALLRDDSGGGGTGPPGAVGVHGMGLDGGVGVHLGGSRDGGHELDVGFGGPSHGVGVGVGGVGQLPGVRERGELGHHGSHEPDSSFEAAMAAVLDWETHGVNVGPGDTIDSSAMMSDSAAAAPSHRFGGRNLHQHRHLSGSAGRGARYIGYAEQTASPAPRRGVAGTSSAFDAPSRVGGVSSLGAAADVDMGEAGSSAAMTAHAPLPPSAVGSVAVSVPAATEGSMTAASTVGSSRASSVISSTVTSASGAPTKGRGRGASSRVTKSSRERARRAETNQLFQDLTKEVGIASTGKSVDKVTVLQQAVAQIKDLRRRRDEANLELARARGGQGLPQ